MALKIPTRQGFLELWIKELIDECMASASERGMVYTRASTYYYTGAMDSRAAIYNKVKPFIDKLAGFLMQPTDVRFQLSYDSGEEEDVLERCQLVAEKLTADFRQTDADVAFAEAQGIAGAITPSGHSAACLCGCWSQDGAGTKHGFKAIGGWKFGNTIDGCQADYVRVPDAMANLAPVPDELTDEQVLMCPDIMSHRLQRRRAR